MRTLAGPRPQGPSVLGDGLCQSAQGSHGGVFKGESMAKGPLAVVGGETGAQRTV